MLFLFTSYIRFFFYAQHHLLNENPLGNWAEKLLPTNFSIDIKKKVCMFVCMCVCWSCSIMYLSIAKCSFSVQFLRSWDFSAEFRLFICGLMLKILSQLESRMWNYLLDTCVAFFWKRHNPFDSGLLKVCRGTKKVSHYWTRI